MSAEPAYEQPSGCTCFYEENVNHSPCVVCGRIEDKVYTSLMGFILKEPMCAKCHDERDDCQHVTSIPLGGSHVER